MKDSSLVKGPGRGVIVIDRLLEAQDETPIASVLGHVLDGSQPLDLREEFGDVRRDRLAGVRGDDSVVSAASAGAGARQQKREWGASPHAPMFAR
jgi:hypothetical protein